MAYPLARELIIDAYIASGVRGLTTEPNSTETRIALGLLNRDLIDQIRNNQFFNSYVKAYTVQSISGQIDYTIGEADANPLNPQPDIVVSQDVIKIVSAQVRVGNAWNTMRQITPGDYFRTEVVESSAVVPNVYTYNRSMDGGFSTISFTQATQGGYLLRFGVNGPVQNYGLDDELALPSGYYAYLKYELAELICIQAGLTETQVIMKQKADECLERIEGVNASIPPLMKICFGNVQYNIGNDMIVNSGGI